MSNARIQFSLASEEMWLAYNPFLKEGEIVTSVKANKKVKLVQGKIGGSNYSDSTLIWDQDNAESLTSRSETAATTAATKASAAASSASAAAASQAAAANSANSAADSASAASGYASTATAKATAAANSASAAASSSATASEKATTAANSASAAASSASQAQSSASTATTKASEAETSATAAFEYKIAAATSASAAEIQANEAADSASEATAKVIEATDEANRAKAEADRAKSISDTIGNPVSDVTENNGSVTVTKSDGTQSTFMAFPQGENGALPIANGGTGATTAKQARANLEVEPIGTIFAFAGNDIPSGYLPCNGGVISRTTYADLFAVIGTTYGSGNGSTTFNLPNLTDRFIQGSNTAGTVKSAGLPNITGVTTGVDGEGDNSRVSGAFQRTSTIARAAAGSNYSRDLLSFDASRCSTIYGKSTTVQPPAVTMRYIIKY